ncbi:MAG TPA: NAD(P)-binding domain-containing protein, partial [Thermoanaerobaculia bacterium]|nr:NAD(P)-binding domain-containing protein [Thermoanaerobaculia bacterium]
MEPVAIVGAGPTGIACAIELGNRGLRAVCYDRGHILQSIYDFPEEMRWYSTRDLLDIAGVPFSVPDAHPTRLETLAYYRGVAEKFRVRVIPDTEVVSITPFPAGGLEVEVK